MRIYLRLTWQDHQGGRQYRPTSLERTQYGGKKQQAVTWVKMTVEATSFPLLHLCADPNYPLGTPEPPKVFGIVPPYPQ